MATCDQSKCSTDECEQSKYVCCSLCLEDGSRIAARHYCVDCEIYYCGKCVKCHNKMPCSRSHHVNDIESSADLPAVDEETREGEDLSTKETLRCAIHQGKLIDTYCKNHDEVCCATCAVVKHRRCSTESIDEAAKDFKSSIEVNESKEALTKVLTQLKQVKDKRTKNIDDIGRQKLESIEAVDKYEEKIIRKIKDLANNSRQEIRSKYEEHKTALDIDVQGLDAFMTTTTSYVDKLERPGNEGNKFVTVKTSKVVKRDVERLLQEMMTEGNDRKIILYLTKKLEGIVDELDSLGSCTVKKYKATLQKSVNIKQKQEPTTTVHAMCFMVSGDLILTDSNNKLKRFNSDLLFKDKITLQGSPVAVCQINKQEVAVRLKDTNINIVQFVSVGQSMKPTYSFSIGSSDAPLGCWSTGSGMAYDAGTGEMFVSECNEVSVYSKTGMNKLRTYDYDTNGKPLFSYFGCKQIALSDNNKDIYVTDTSTGLIVFDRKGHLKKKIPLSGIKDVWPLCILPGNVCLIGSESSGVIVQIDKDGKQIGTIINANEERESTRCVACDNEHSKLIVGGSSSEIYVYTLSPN